MFPVKNQASSPATSTVGLSPVPSPHRVFAKLAVVGNELTAIFHLPLWRTGAVVDTPVVVLGAKGERTVLSPVGVERLTTCLTQKY